MIAASVLRARALSGGTAWYAVKSAAADVLVSSPAGRGRAKSRETKSARSPESSISALYIRCVSRFCRRMSNTKAIFGLNATR